ncbi:hypothetical protein COCNU_scaffold004936G000010 [Cocos nucifera]|nr:hypothetical protein [Cocos nucifera]
MAHRLRAEALKVQEDLQAEVNHLQEEKVAEVDRLAKEKAAKVGGLQELAFIKGFELCKDKVASKFSKLDLSFWGEEAPSEKAGPSTTASDPSPAEVVPEPFEPTVEVSEPAQEPEVAENAPTLSDATSLKVENLE